MAAAERCRRSLEAAADDDEDEEERAEEEEEEEAGAGVRVKAERLNFSSVCGVRGGGEERAVADEVVAEGGEEGVFVSRIMERRSGPLSSPDLRVGDWKAADEDEVELRGVPSCPARKHASMSEVDCWNADRIR